MRKKSNYFEKGKTKTWIERLLNYRYASQHRTKEKIVRTVSKVSAGMCRAFEGKKQREKSECIGKAENRLLEDS